MSEPHPHLTPAGAERRAAILSLATQALEGRMRKRRARRAGAISLLLALAALSLLLQRSGVARISPRTPRELANLPDPAHQAPAAYPAGLQLISDEQLIEEFAAVGIRAGVVRIGSETRLVAEDGREIKPPTRFIFPATS